MKKFQCNFCSYSSNYKHDVKRHSIAKHPDNGIVYDNRQMTNPHNNNNNNQMINPHNSSQMINPNPHNNGSTQALNVANNFNIPSVPSQIINIQPPNPVVSRGNENKKKPIMMNSHQDKYDIRLKETFKMFVCGPSGCGKTTFMGQLLKNMNAVTKSTPKKIVLVYKVWQPQYLNMGFDVAIEDSPEMISQINQLVNGDHTLVVFDDLINSNNLESIGNLFAVDGRHKNMSLVFITQRYFENNNHFRQISGNIDYSVMFKNPINASEIRILASRMTPGKRELVDYYNKATEQPYSYLFINLTQECKNQTKFLSHLFDVPHVVRAYYNSSIKSLHDDHKGEVTDYSKMTLTNEIDQLNHANNGHNNNQNNDNPPDDAAIFTKLNQIPDPEHHDPYDDMIESRLNNLRNQEPSRVSTTVGTVGTQTNTINTHDAVNGPTFSTVGTSTTPIIRTDNAIGPDYKHLGMQTLPIDYTSVHTETESSNHNHFGIQTIPISTKNKRVGPSSSTSKGIQTMHIPTHDVGVGSEEYTTTSMNTDPITTHAVGVGDRSYTSIGSNTDPITTHDVGVDYHEESAIPTVSYPDEYPDDDVDMTPPLPEPDANEMLEGPVRLALPLPNNPEVIPLPGPSNESRSLVPVYENYEDVASNRRTLRINTPIFEQVRHPLRLMRRPGTDPANPHRTVVSTQDINPNIYDNYLEHTCRICSESFISKRALINHQHSCSMTTFACSLCGLNLPTRRALSGHITAMHYTRTPVDKKTKLANKNRKGT